MYASSEDQAGKPIRRLASPTPNLMTDGATMSAANTDLDM
jgi:hypothetical protein